MKFMKTSEPKLNELINFVNNFLVAPDGIITILQAGASWSLLFYFDAERVRTLQYF